MIFLNPVVISVVVMVGLCLTGLNIVMALLVAAVAAGAVAGIGIAQTFAVLVSGMGGAAETALAYFLLGVFAAAISKTGLTNYIAMRATNVIKERKILLVFFLMIAACISGTIVPIHIAFIPILVPPLLHLLNKLKVDRRQIACALGFGLKCPYVTLPIAYGLIFQGLIADEMTRNGMKVNIESVPSFTWVLGIGMIIGFMVSVFISYNKPREYEERPILGGLLEEGVNDNFNKKHLMATIAIVVAFVIQLLFSSLPAGAFAALAVMILTGAVKWRDIDECFEGGLKLMGFIAFVVLIASGYGAVLRETESVEQLVEGVVGAVGGSTFWGAFLMLAVGLLVTMGIGTSFGTIPIIAAIYTPLAIKLGFTTGATVCLVAAAAALGDAGTPVSDTALGPTAGLNADGQHNHIWDTCVPQFLHYNVPLFIAGLIGATLLF